MVSQNIIAVLGLASTAVATFHPQALKSLRDLRVEHTVVEVREAQSNDINSSACLSSASAIITDAPTPSAALGSYFATFAATADLTNPSALCQITAGVPSSLSAEYSSYDQQASSWFSQHSSDIEAVVSKCGTDEDVASVSQVLSLLEDFVGGGCTGSVSRGLAARPTGVIAGAVAAAGVLGAAAVL